MGGVIAGVLVNTAKDAMLGQNHSVSDLGKSLLVGAVPAMISEAGNDGFDRVSRDLRRDERLFDLLEIPSAQCLDRDLVGERAGARVHAIAEEVIVAQGGHVLSRQQCHGPDSDRFIDDDQMQSGYPSL